MTVLFFHLFLLPFYLAIGCDFVRIYISNSKFGKIIFAVLPTSALQLSQGGDGLHSGGGGSIVQYATQSQDGQFFVPGECICSVHPHIHTPHSRLCHFNLYCVSALFLIFTVIQC